MNLLNWESLGRSWKSIKEKLDPAIAKMTIIKEDEIVFTNKMRNFLFSHIDTSSRTIYRYIEYLITLQIITPIPIQGEQLYDVRNHKAVTFQLNKELLKQIGHIKSYKKTAVKTYIEKESKKIIGQNIEQIIKHECFEEILRTIFYKIMNDPIKIIQYLIKHKYKVEQLSFGFGFTSKIDVKHKTIEEKKKLIDNKLKKYPFKYGKFIQFNWDIFMTATYEPDIEAWNYFQSEIEKQIPKIPDNIIEILAYNNKDTPDLYKQSLRSYITFHWTQNQVGVKFFRRTYSNICSSRSFYRTDISKELFDKTLLNELDIHAAVLAVQRLITKEKWIEDGYDLKEEIINTAQTNSLNINHIKALSFRILFSKNEDLSYSKYAILYDKKLKCWRPRTVFDNASLPVINKQTYNTLYHATLKVCGPNIGTSVFYYESIIEQMTVQKLKQLGYKTYNVYDCCYSEANQDVMYNAMKNSAYEFLTMLKQSPDLQKGLDKNIIGICKE
jgi:hypothetical protein